ncbi:MAG: hypothetical protein NTY81_03335 [Candidatus Staskawiczbacteria bacterium]|nr:hypothetical protein [Candidatus Staskawiczbacteria bacterium]
MTTIALNYSIVQKKIQAKVDSVEVPSVNWKAICFAGFFMSLFLLVFYVWQINDLTKGSYLMNTYEKQISQLSDENKNLQISSAESSFLGQAVVKIQALNFQKTSSVKYMQIPDSSVAVNIK